jgi:hypothetical protein
MGSVPLIRDYQHRLTHEQPGFRADDEHGTELLGAAALRCRLE